MKFAASYSGGKESALSVYTAMQQGHTPVALITTYNTDAGRSHFHGLTEAVLNQVSAAVNIPLWLIKTSGKDYTENFEKALQRAKDQGAEACVFGDIDIEGHREWCTQRCEKIGLVPMFPLWGMERAQAVHTFIDSGFTANITVVNTQYLTDDFLGNKLTKEVAAKIAATDADICGENGEYHTFVSNGPMFKHPVSFTYGEKITQDNHAMLPVLGS